MRAPKLPGRVLTRGAGGPEWGGTLPHEHYGLCWQLWSERGIPELTACAAHCFCPSPWFSLSASLLSVSLHSPNTKLCLSSAEPTALKASVSALREKNSLYAKKTSTSHGNALCIDPATCGYKVTLLPRLELIVTILYKIVVSDASSPTETPQKVQLNVAEKKKTFPLEHFQREKEHFSSLQKGFWPFKWVSDGMVPTETFSCGVSWHCRSQHGSNPFPQIPFSWIKSETFCLTDW